MHGGNGADAERERIVAAVAAAERAQVGARREASRARDVRAASSRVAPAGPKPADVEQLPLRLRPGPYSPPRARPSPQMRRGNGTDAERERVVAAVAAAECAQAGARREASRARDVCASSSRVASAGRKPADDEQPPLRPRVEPPLPLRARPLPQMHRGNGADAERERVVAAVAAAARAQAKAPRSEPSARCSRLELACGVGRLQASRRRARRARESRRRRIRRRARSSESAPRGEPSAFAPRAGVRRRPASSQPTPSSRRRL